MVVMVLHLTTLVFPFPFPFLFLFLFPNRIIFLVNKKEKNRKEREKYDISILPPNPKKGNCRIYLPRRYLPTYLRYLLFLV